MKVALRFIYMSFMAMVLMPLIVLIEVIWFGYLLYLSKSLKQTVVAWSKYLWKGIEMNVDFIKNGL